MPSAVPPSWQPAWKVRAEHGCGLEGVRRRQILSEDLAGTLLAFCSRSYVAVSTNGLIRNDRRLRASG